MSKQKKSLYPLHVLIGAAIVLIFWIIPPIEPITPVGMRCLGTFISMIYLWSTVEPMWPSVIGLFLFGISGYTEAFGDVWLNAMGNSVVLLVLFSMVLFGALDEVGDTMYIARWFLTRKIFKGRPYIFIATFYICCYVLSALIDPIVSLILLWPIALKLMSGLGINRSDSIWAPFFMGMFFVTAFGQPLFPFKGAQMVPISSFATMTSEMGAPQVIPMVPYMLVSMIMSLLIMTVYIFILKFVLRLDVSKLKAVDPIQINKQFELPQINLKQKLYLYMIPCYLIMMLLPSLMAGNPIADFFNKIGALGVTIFWTVLFVVIRWEGKPLLDFREVAYRQMNWGIIFMIASAVYGVKTLASASTGITDFIIVVMNPVLGGQPEIVFVAVMYLVALIITQFANNGAMATLLLPVILTFSEQLQIEAAPVAMGVILMVFVAMLTPGASPHAGMMFGMKDIYDSKYIYLYGFSMSLFTWAFYVVLGYPLCKFILSAFS